jgi:Mn2+/Fe2+ NRAMP family transporter
MEARLDQMPTPPDGYLWAGLLAVLTSALLYVGQYGLIERVATVFVGAFTAVTIATLFLLQATDWAVTSQHIADGFSFQLPPIGERFSDNPLATALAAFGLIGLGSGELIMYPYWCLEKGYAQYTGLRDGTKSWLKRAKGWIRVLHTDAWLSMGVYTFATVAFYLLGAAVLWRSGLNPAGQGLIRTLAEMYVPVFGTWAYDVFLLGAFAVLYSTFFVVAAGYARIVADGLQLFGLIGETTADRARWTKILSVAWPIIAAVIYAFLQAPAAMVLASGVAQAVMLPMLGFAALYFRYRRTDPNLTPSRIWDVLLWLSFAGLLVAGLGSLYSTFVG